jgi:hypothetical protein
MGIAMDVLAFALNSCARSTLRKDRSQTPLFVALTGVTDAVPSTPGGTLTLSFTSLAEPRLASTYGTGH